MKKIALATVAMFAVTSSTAFAGGMAEPVMEPEVIVENTSSSGGILIPLLLLILVIAAISSSSDSTSTPASPT